MYRCIQWYDSKIGADPCCKRGSSQDLWLNEPSVSGLNLIMCEACADTGILVSYKMLSCISRQTKHLPDEMKRYTMIVLPSSSSQEGLTVLRSCTANCAVEPRRAKSPTMVPKSKMTKDTCTSPSLNSNLQGTPTLERIDMPFLLLQLKTWQFHLEYIKTD